VVILLEPVCGRTEELLKLVCPNFINATLYIVVVTVCHSYLTVCNTLFCIIGFCMAVTGHLGGVMVSVIVIRTAVCGLKPGQDNGYLGRQLPSEGK
jgi:hypothetical protein